MKKVTDLVWSDIELYCNTCKQVENVLLRENGPHIEARCSECLGYIKNIKQSKNDPGQGNICPPSTMSQGLYGSICIEDLFGQHIVKDNNGRSWISVDNLLQKPFEQSQKNGKHYVGIAVWINDEYDQYQNIGSVVLSQTKAEADARAKKVYLGNLKYMQQPQQQYQQPAGGYPPAAAQGFAQPNTYQTPQQQNFQQNAPQQQYQQQPPYQQPAGQPQMAAPNAGSYGQQQFQGPASGPQQNAPAGQGPGNQFNQPPAGQQPPPGQIGGWQQPGNIAQGAPSAGDLPF